MKVDMTEDEHLKPTLLSPVRRCIRPSFSSQAAGDRAPGEKNRTPSQSSTDFHCAGEKVKVIFELIGQFSLF